MVNKICMILLVALLLGIMPVIGCTGKEDLKMTQDGNTIKVHYKGTLQDGFVFDSSVGGEPLEFTIGARQMIPGFEAAVMGMQVGQSKTVTIPSDDAYGPHMAERVWTIEREQLPEEAKPEVGQQVQLQRIDGLTIEAAVCEVTETAVKVDTNHPLAGKDLTFEIELVEINQ
ncbi:peptidylprolyl isomerase [Chloroflexota bacterium]